MAKRVKLNPNEANLWNDIISSDPCELIQVGIIQVDWETVQMYFNDKKVKRLGQLQILSLIGFSDFLNFKELCQWNATCHDFRKWFPTGPHKNGCFDIFIDDNRTTENLCDKSKIANGHLCLWQRDQWKPIGYRPLFDQGVKPQSRLKSFEFEEWVKAVYSYTQRYQISPPQKVFN